MVYWNNVRQKKSFRKETVFYSSNIVFIDQNTFCKNSDMNNTTKHKGSIYFSRI